MANPVPLFGLAFSVLGVGLLVWGLIDRSRRKDHAASGPTRVADLRHGEAAVVSGQTRAVVALEGPVSGKPAVYLRRSSEVLNQRSGFREPGDRYKDAGDNPLQWVWNEVEAEERGLFWLGDPSGWVLVAPAGAGMRLSAARLEKPLSGSGRREGDQRTTEHAIYDGSPACVWGTVRSKDDLIHFLRAGGSAAVPHADLQAVLELLEGPDAFYCLFADGGDFRVADRTYEQIDRGLAESSNVLLVVGIAMLVIGLGILGAVGAGAL